MAKKTSYFDSRKDIVQIFEDLEALLDFCRFELLPYNPADLYNRSSYVWRKFETATNREPVPNKRYYNKKKK